MRDLLLAVTGHEIEDRIPCAALETMVARKLHMNELPAPALPSPIRPPIAYRGRFSEEPSVQFLSLDASESANLLRSARMAPPFTPLYLLHCRAC